MLIGHKKQWDFLKRKFELGQLSHAYLFTGAEGIGKKLFAEEFAKFIGCKFPDLMVLREANKKDPVFVPPQRDPALGGRDGGEIKISQVREVQNFLSYKSYNGGYKIVIVDDAHVMNQEAQSCFLKTLEEPKGQTILFLISCKPDMLLPTILSRCQTIKFFKPSPSVGELPENLEKSDRQKKLLKDLLPLIGSNYSEKFKYVKSIDFEKQSAVEIVEVLQKYLRQDIIKNKKILKLTGEINNKLVFTNANPKLALEILLMEL